MSLSPEELEMFGESDAAEPVDTEAAQFFDAPAPIIVEACLHGVSIREACAQCAALPAVLPPDAPKNDANAPAPEKATKKPKKAKAEPLTFDIAGMGTVTSTGDVSAKGKPIVTTTAGERYEVGALPQIPDSVQTIVLELGPKTLEALARLLGK
jgi:ribosomal protein L12E/L44/L45/RPP1/RPP2